MPPRLLPCRRGETILHEEFLPVLLARHRDRRLKFTRSLSEGVRHGTVIFVAVGTPACESGHADVSLVEEVCRDLAHHLDGSRLVVVKSTVPPGTNLRIRQMFQRNGAGSHCVEAASIPEFLREGTAVTDFLYPDRIVLGCNCERGAELLRQVYQPLLDGSYAESNQAIPMPDNAIVPARAIVTSPASAELIKQASNAFLAMKISFINAIANICEGSGADIADVAEGVGSDRRIGNKFLNPGIGYGGSCFPKDLLALGATARECGYDFALLDEVTRINEGQRRAFLGKVRRALCTLPGKRLAVLGLAFKAGTDDVRESPAVAIVRSLLREGCEIAAYDPAATGRVRSEFSASAGIRFLDNPYDAAADADALLVLTDWEEFAELDLERMRTQLRDPIVVDGRNLFQREQMIKAGLTYYSVGRPEATPGVRRAIQRADAA